MKHRRWRRSVPGPPSPRRSFRSRRASASAPGSAARRYIFSFSWFPLLSCMVFRLWSQPTSYNRLYHTVFAHGRYFQGFFAAVYTKPCGCKEFYANERAAFRGSPSSCRQSVDSLKSKNGNFRKSSHFCTDCTAKGDYRPLSRSPHASPTCSVWVCLQSEGLPSEAALSFAQSAGIIPLFCF